MSDFQKLARELSASDASIIRKAIASQDVAPDSWVLTDCISVTIEDGEACLELPLDLGKKCIDVPDWVPDGEVAKVCVSVKKKWGVPVGVNVCVYVADIEVACAYFGI